MATRFIVGDPVVLTNTFSVSGTATDPDTVTLAVTDPSGNTDTYTYSGGTVTKSSTGVYTKTVTTDEAGTWLYTWTGTGAAADVEDGYFEVAAVAAADSLDVVTFGEAKQALNHDVNTQADWDVELRMWITAVSRRLDELCGPVVQRTVTDEAHDGGRSVIWLRETPIASVTSVTEYADTTSTALTAETNASKPSDGYLLESRSHYVKVVRRASNGDSTFPDGRQNVVVTYTAGRYTTTESVDPKFKLAAQAILRRLWNREAGAWATGGDPFGGGVPFFRVLSDSMIREFLADELKPPAVH